VKKGHGKNLTFQKISDRFSITTIEKVIILGLDQYLEVRKYVSKYDHSNFDYRTDTWPPPISKQYADLISTAPAGVDKYADFGGAYITYPVAQWRKANAIHGWFVVNVQDGEDNCGTYYVPREKLAELAEACEEILKVPAGHKREDAAELVNLLPTRGFFFGSYDMDEYYDQDLKYTIEVVNHALSTIPDDFEYSFYYSSSW